MRVSSGPTGVVISPVGRDARYRSEASCMATTETEMSNALDIYPSAAYALGSPSSASTSCGLPQAWTQESQ